MHVGDRKRGMDDFRDRLPPFLFLSCYIYRENKFICYESSYIWREELISLNGNRRVENSPQDLQGHCQILSFLSQSCMYACSSEKALICEREEREERSEEWQVEREPSPFSACLLLARAWGRGRWGRPVVVPALSAGQLQHRVLSKLLRVFLLLPNTHKREREVWGEEA